MRWDPDLLNIYYSECGRRSLLDQEVVGRWFGDKIISRVFYESNKCLVFFFGCVTN